MDLQLGDLFELPQSVQQWIGQYHAVWGEVPANLPKVALWAGIHPHWDKQQSYTTILFEYQKKFKRMQVPIPVGHKYVKVDGGEEFRKRMMASQKADMEASMQFGLRGINNIGSDPEIFVLDGKGQLLPAYEFLKGKEEMKDTAPYARTYWDGFQAEFTTEPRHCLAYHVDSIQAGLLRVFNAARAHDKKATFSIDNVVKVQEEVMANAKQEYVEFGCDPSHNAYGVGGLRVMDARMLPYRFAGGHIHLDMGAIPITDAIPIVKAIDKIAGVASVGMFEKYDNAVRREFYGLAGEFRLPSYGLEYRVLSNAWLTHPAITHFTFELVRAAAKLQFVHMDSFWEGTEDEVQHIINRCDVAAARVLIKRNEAVYRRLFEGTYNGKKGSMPYGPDVTKLCVKKGMDILLNGIHNLVSRDLEKNWALSAAVRKESWRVHSEGHQWSQLVAV